MGELSFRSARDVSVDEGMRLHSGGPAHKGRRVTHANGVPVRSRGALAQELARAGGGPVRLTVRMTTREVDAGFVDEQRRVRRMLSALDKVGTGVAHTEAASQARRRAAERCCPSGHALVPTVHGRCDECGRRADGLGCPACDYDVCWACAPAVARHADDSLSPEVEVRTASCTPRGFGFDARGPSCSECPPPRDAREPSAARMAAELKPYTTELRRRSVSPRGGRAVPSRPTQPSTRHYRFRPL